MAANKITLARNVADNKNLISPYEIKYEDDGKVFVKWGNDEYITFDTSYVLKNWRVV